jgi:hypothetical protein
MGEHMQNTRILKKIIERHPILKRGIISDLCSWLFWRTGGKNINYDVIRLWLEIPNFLERRNNVIVNGRRIETREVVNKINESIKHYSKYLGCDNIDDNY